MIEEDFVLHDEPEAVRYVVLLIEGRPEVVIDRMVQEDGSYKWAVRDECRGCFSTSKRGTWSFERMPSGRPKNWIKRYRFNTFEAAVEGAKRGAKVKLKQYQQRLAVANRHWAEREARAVK